jgi:hypothetical protein
MVERFINNILGKKQKKKKGIDFKGYTTDTCDYAYQKKFSFENEY